MAIDAGNFNGTAHFHLQPCVAMHVLHEVAIDAVHALFNMDVHQMHGQAGAFVGVFGIAFLMNGLMLFYLLRFGYLATVVVMTCNYFMGHFPPDLHWANWYASSSTLCILFLAFLTAYGFRVATAGQKTLADDFD